VVHDRGGRYWYTPEIDRDAVDTSYLLGVELVLFRGPVEVRGLVEGSYRFNRYLQSDAKNAHVELGVAWRP
jgi:hypothetical protein